MNKIKVCNLCLDVILDYSFKKLENAMLGMLSPNLDESNSEDQVICSKCSDSLLLASKFKTSCLGNNDYIKGYVGCCESNKLNLEEVIIKKQSFGVKSEDESICRFCLNYFERNLLVELKNLEQHVTLKSMLETCLPEIDLNITENPLMCNGCMDSLQNQFNFTTSCRDNKEKLFAKEQLDTLKEKKVQNNESESGNVLFETKHVKVEKVDNNILVDTVKNDEDLEEKEDETESMDFPKKVGKTHKLTSNLGKMFTCTLCSYHTYRKQSLKHHYVTHQDPSEVKQYKCNECNYVTKWIHSLNVHTLKHTNSSKATMFKCKNCSFQTKYKDSLKKHSLKHTDNENLQKYKCTDCSYATLERYRLRLHYKNVHKGDIELQIINFLCRHCRYNAKSKEDLERHKKVHNPEYECDQCEYKTKDVSNFKRHMKKHSSFEEEIYDAFYCDECGFKTKYKCSLVLHIKGHKNGTARKPNRRDIK